MRKENKEVKEVKENKEVEVVGVKEFSNSEIENLNKDSRIFLFLSEINKEMSKEEVIKLYLDKYNLNEKSNSINIRVIERFLGVYSKYSKEVKEEKIKVLKEEIKKYNIDYSSLIKKYKIVKEKSKRSNRINNFMEIKI